MAQWIGYQATKRTLIATLSGQVLEIGPGKGANLPLLPPGINWTGLEPHPRTRRTLTQAATAAKGTSPPTAHPGSGMGGPGDSAAAAQPSADRGDPGASYPADTGVVGGGGRRVVAGWAEEIPLLSASVDVVLSTAVLCSVDDLGAVLAEIRRVLRPGGRFVFLEHVAAPRGSGLRRLQRMIAPITRVVDRGCDPSRDIAPAIEAAFDSVDLSHYTASGLLKIPFIAGTAYL